MYFKKYIWVYGTRMDFVKKTKTKHFFLGKGELNIYICIFHIYIFIFFFLGLWALAGYGSLKLYYVILCFLYEKYILNYDMFGGICTLFTLTLDDVGFWALVGL